MTTTESVTLPPMAATTSDFDFLRGDFDVVSRRLRDPFDPGSGWAESRATSRATLFHGGAISVDEMWFPDDGRYGMSLRLFDPEARQWSVYWVTSTDGVLGAPVTGQWRNGRCRLTGPDLYDGRAILASYCWSDVTDTSAHWEQEFSVDDGETWQLNWTMDFVRRSTPPDHNVGPKVTSDFDFWDGTWHARHRRLPAPLEREDDWVEFESVCYARTYFNGAISIDEIGLADPGVRGFTIRTFEPAARRWSIYWVNSRSGRLGLPPVRGRFENGVGKFRAREELDGRMVDVRFVWDDISATTARWQQAFRYEPSAPWVENWVMTFARLDGPA